MLRLSFKLLKFAVLATWFRLKYPHIAIGALASSAPILYFDNLVSQDAYDSIVTTSFKVQIEWLNVLFVWSLTLIKRKLIRTRTTYVDIALQDASESCYETIKKSWSEIDKIASEENGLSILTRRFNVCK